MRTIYIPLCSVAVILMISGCSGHTLQDWADAEFNGPDVATPNKTVVEKSESATVPEAGPSQNPGLQRVSPMPVAASEGGTMQESLDQWTKEEWTPITEQDEKIKAMNEDEDRPFTIQEYVDKAMIYHANKPESGEPSHNEHLDTLPVIGE